MVGRCSSIAVFFWLVIVSPAFADLVPNLEFQVTVPDSLTINGRIDFEDLDGDGTAEMLFLDRNPIATYSLTEHRTIDFFRYRQDGLRHSYRAAFVHNDYHVDVVETVILPGETSPAFALVINRGVHGYQTTDTLYWTADLESDREYLLDQVYVADADRDGLVEIYGGYYYVEEVWESPWDTEPTRYYFRTSFAYSLEEAAFQVVDQMPPDRQPFYVSPGGDGGVASISYRSSESHSGRTHGLGNRTYISFGIQIEDTLGTVHSHWFWCKVGCPNSGASYNDYGYAAWLAAVAAGDFRSDVPGIELVMKIGHSFWVMGPFDDCGASAIQLVTFNLADPDTMVVLTDVMPYQGPLDFLFLDSRFPDYFLSIGGGVIRLHDAATYEVFDYSTSTLAGTWVGYRTVHNGELPVAVLRSGRTFSFYSIATAPITDKDDDPPAQLPQSFNLGQPYPNPFNPSVTVPVSLPNAGRLRVQVFNVLGQEIGVLYEGKAGPGEMGVVWDAADFPSGVYFFKVVFDDLPKTVSAVLVK